MVDNLLRIVNPSGFIIILYAALIFVFALNLYRIISDKIKIINTILKAIELCGKYSMTIFLYHLMFLWIATYIFNKIPIDLQGIYFLKLGLYIIFAIPLPLLIKICYEKIIYIFKNKEVN